MNEKEDPAPKPGPVVIRPDGPTFEAPKPGTSLAVQKAGTMQQALQGLIPTSIGEAFTWAGYLAKSTAIPANMRGKPETVLTVILAGMEVGLTPIRAVQSITNISGNLAMRADLQLALVRRDKALSFFDESYEDKGRTDRNLAARLKVSMRQFDPAEVDLVLAKIQAAVEGMPDGKPYAWAVGLRTGEAQLHVRTFTWLDAERAVIWEKDEDNPGGTKEKKPLSQKFNYVAFPGDMYPKRARTRLFQVLASDSTLGLPAVEAIEGGQILEAEFSRVEDGPGDDVATLLAGIDAEDAETGTSIRAGFKQLNMGPAKQLQKLVQFKGKPADLLDWLKTEWAGQKGIPRKKPDVLGADQVQTTQPQAPTQAPAAAQEQATQVQEGQVVEDSQPAAQAEPQAQDGPKPVDPVKPEPKKGKTADLAARFKAGVTF